VDVDCQILLGKKKRFEDTEFFEEKNPDNVQRET
jgi:hypothetical protein